jgi:hypothetical protein
MIYVVIAAVLGFAGWQLYKFVRRINTGSCASGGCSGCHSNVNCSLQDITVGKGSIRRLKCHQFSPRDPIDHARIHKKGTANISKKTGLQDHFGIADPCSFVFF